MDNCTISTPKGQSRSFFDEKLYFSGLWVFAYMAAKKRGRPLRRARSRVPSFALYGERGGPEAVMLHIEDVQARSRRYSWEIDAHRHGALYQLICVTSGPVEVSLDGRSLVPRSPCVVVVPPSVIHAFHFGPETTGYVLSLSAKWLVAGKLDELGEAVPMLFAKPRVLEFSEGESGALSAAGFPGELLNELLTEFRRPDGATSPMIGWLARAVVWRLAQFCAREQLGSHREYRHHDVFGEFRRLIEEHYLEHWPLATYAKALNLSVERLNRLCRRHAGTSAFELVQERLVHEAGRRLIYVVVPVVQLARELGFADPGYFCRFFKRHTGCTPNEYRRRHEER
jgi:AraC family transcriptional regulator, transcriptional activator of pobA